jgi:hypothetical protein
MKKSARQKSDTDHWSKHEQKASSKICTKKTNPAPDPPTTTKAADKAQHQANGTDYRYTVEFSKNGHAPLFGLSTSSRATRGTLPEDLGQFKPPRSSSPRLTRRSVNFATSRVSGSEGRVVWLGWCGSGGVARPAQRVACDLQVRLCGSPRGIGKLRSIPGQVKSPGHQRLSGNGPLPDAEPPGPTETWTRGPARLGPHPADNAPSPIHLAPPVGE